MKEYKLRINEAIEHAKAQGIKIKKKELAAALYPFSTPMGQQSNLYGILSGRKERLYPEQIMKVCELCGVTPNFLFGYED